MKICTILLIVLFLRPSAASWQSGNRDIDIATMLLSLERSRFSAQQNNDIGVLNSLFDDSLMLVKQDGDLLTKAAYLETLRDPGTRRESVVPESMAVRVFTRTAIVVGIYNEKGIVAGSAYHRRCRFIDTWAFKNGKWVCIAATATSTIS